MVGFAVAIDQIIFQNISNMPSKRHSRKSHSRKRRHSKSRAYGRRRRSMYGGDQNVYFVNAWQGDSALTKLIDLGYVFIRSEGSHQQYLTTSKFVDIIDKHFAGLNSIPIDSGYHMFAFRGRSNDYGVELRQGDAMIGQVTLDRIPISLEPMVKSLPGYL